MRRWLCARTRASIAGLALVSAAGLRTSSAHADRVARDAPSVRPSQPRTTVVSEPSLARAEVLERQGDHEGAAAMYGALLSSTAAIDARALASRAEHIVTLVRASRSDSEGWSICERIAQRIESATARTTGRTAAHGTHGTDGARVALTTRLRCAEQELSTLAERRRVSGPTGPDLYAIERGARTLCERLTRLESDATALRTVVEPVFARALMGRAFGLLGDESAALSMATAAATQWAALVDAPSLVDALSVANAANVRATRIVVRPAPVLAGRAPGPSERERVLRLAVGESLVDRTWSAVVGLVWVAIERDRRTVTNARIEPLPRGAGELRRERWFTTQAAPVLDRHRALLADTSRTSLLSRYAALWNADATSARFAAALRVGELYMDLGERSRAVQDTLIEASDMPDVLRGYVSPSDEAHVTQARGVFERCVSEAQRAGIENEWVRACAQRLRYLGSPSGVVVDEMVPLLNERRGG